MATQVRIARYLAIYQGYAKNGNNRNRRTPACVFVAEVNGSPVSSRTSLKNALAIARDFDPKVTKSSVYDPIPIPEYV